MKHYLHVGVDGVDEPFILFGSSFPKDKEYTQVCPMYKGYVVHICMIVQDID